LEAGAEQYNLAVTCLRRRTVRFHAAATSGKTKPSHVVCRTPDGSTVEVVAKFTAGCERADTGLAMEVVAACLAADLKLPVPKPYLLDIDREWVRTVTDTSVQKMMLDSSPVAFGSTHVGPGYRAWSTGDRINDAILPDALGTFVFDAMSANPDRRLSNPNCLLKGNELRIFDHELTFLYKGIVGWQQPWKLGALASMASPGNHIFLPGLKGRMLDLAPVERAWSDISDVRLVEYQDAVPSAWSTAHSAVEDALNLIRGVRDNIVAALAEVRRVLS